MNKRQILAGVALMLILVFSLVGCGSEKPSDISNNANAAILTFNLNSPPETIDPGRVVGQPDMTLVNAVMEGLTRYNVFGELEPAMATHWEISEDKSTYTFYIREEAKWSNGEPVTAHDFEFAWKRVLDPEYASRYAYQLYYIVNAFEYNNLENTNVTDPDLVGVTALDEHTLKVVLNAPAPQFLGLTAFPTYFPVHRETVENNPNWAEDIETYINNGPFKIDKWQEQQRIELVKHEMYWDKDNVQLDRLVFTLVSEQGTSLAMYEAGSLDVLYNIPSQDLERLKRESQELRFGDDLSVSKYLFNTTIKPFDDPGVRKALAMAIERQDIVDFVTRAGERPAYAYVPYGVPDITETKDFRETGGEYFAEDLEYARNLLSQAGFPDGMDFPEVTLLITDSEDNLRIAQAVQEMWRKNLGIDTIKIQPNEWRVYLQSIFTGQYQMAGAAWSADYVDAMTFLDVYVSDGGNNVTGWGNSEYDQLISIANNSYNQAERVQAMHRAEELLMDEMPIIPLFYYTKPYLIKDHVNNVGVPSFGPQMEFKWAYIKK
ncbi:peptide ABC transporter substrate-binding protein [Desulfitibacter alkalitolerans]|uniref:peptide ABC transporter substrate-binding protein n=1 Tax=Desulfitibacter alkalitolerans TaxID=264641 RepID=UPI000480B209|nr:peptide ABC transporter substrate-binding protein [Desulfitibacter alkalitolerans]